ncbi:MAG: DUF4230 domain-containing protein [Acidobacteria bacterium]|nr:DUF4230 domain-containing protein [Acidobacteriota bacterium]
MRRVLVPAALAACLWLATTVVATAQDGNTDTRPSSTTWFGDTGLWFVPTGEILPSGTWSISGYRVNFDREQGLTDISHFIGTVGVGIGDRVELFGSVRADTRFRRVARPLFDPTNPDNGGVLNEYPFITKFWSDDGIGDLIIGAKFNIASEHRQQPAALAIRAAVKVPTGDKAAGRSTGEADVMVDFIVSKNIQERVELSGFGGVLVRGEPNGITLGNSIRWGFGAGFPTGGSVKLFTELHGEVPLEDDVTLTTSLVGIDGTQSAVTSPISTPVDLTIGLLWQARGGAFVGAGLNYAVNQETGVLAIEIPRAQIFYTYLDSNSTTVLDRDTGLFTKGDDLLESDTRAEAERILEAQAIEAGILDRAQTSAENFLTGFFTSLGYTDVVIETVDFP